MFLQDIERTIWNPATLKHQIICIREHGTLKFINGDETAISRYFDRNRERKGYQALSEGLMALASARSLTTVLSPCALT